MRRDCIQAIALALGREPNQQQVRDIEQRFVVARRTLAEADPHGWAAKSIPQRLAEAAQQAAKDLIGEAQLKADREAMQIAANSRYDAYRTDAMARGLTEIEALDRRVAFHADGKTNDLSIETRAKTIGRDYLRELIPVMEASNPKWFGLLENLEGVRAIVKEIHGEDSGNPVAKAGAKIWHEVAEKARTRFNANGGDIGKLDDWGMPHHHSQVLVARAGREEWLATLSPKERALAKLWDRPPPADWARKSWVSDILPRLDRAKYVNEDGSPMTSEQLGEFLNEAWTTIATGGANKLEPGQARGVGMRANRGNASRSIHFKDADNYIDYQGKFGERSLYEVLVSHIEGISKDIAMVEELGPNPDAAAKMIRDTAIKNMKVADPAHTGRVSKDAIKSENLYNVVSGKTQPVASQRLAETFDTWRNWLSAARLGGAAISSITDDATLHLTGYLNNLPKMQLLANELAAFNPRNKTEERMANRAGLALNSFISSLNRFGSDGIGSSFSRKLANTVMRAQGLNAMTDARRRAYGVTQFGALGAVAKDHANLGKLDADDARFLKSKGVTEEEFRTWKAADVEDWGSGNDTMLTPDSIYRIPDEKIDSVIGGRVADLKREAQASIDDLKTRDTQDQQWVQKRADKLSAWLTKEAANILQKVRTANADARVELGQLAARMDSLREKVDAARASWDTPPDADTPGVNNQERVGTYGKGQLRSKGVDEGAAREAMRQVRSEMAAVNRELAKSKSAAVEKLRERYEPRKAELDEFTKDSVERVKRRGQVADRLERQIEPAIARMRTNAREDAATRLLGIALEETDVAVIEPGAKERAFMGAGIQRGTWRGELMKSFFLFKSFPLAMIGRHVQRAMNLPTGTGRAAYLAALMAGTTVLGAMAMQVKEVLAGRDPRNLNPLDGGGRNWLKAFLQGGSLGLYGDFLFSEATQHGQSALASFAGPVAGSFEDAFKLTQGNIMQASQGKDTDFGAEAVRFTQGNLPGANLWYARAAFNHMLFDNLQEYFSPGYLSRVRGRAQKEFQQQYYWEPGTISPQRAPDVTAIAGEK